MHRASSKTSYSQVPAGMEEADVHVVAEPVVADFTAEGLSWTDDFFQGDTDIVAAFDYDLQQLKDMKIAEITGPLWGLGSTASIGGFVWSIGVGMPVFVPIGCALLFIAGLASTAPTKRYLEKRVDKVWAHTAVTRTGVRHVQPSNPNQPGFALEIPFEDVLSIKIETLPSNFSVAVRLTLASTDDGLEYITSGYCNFGKTQEIKLCLIGLKEPVRFKKLIMTMKENVAPSSSSRASSLLSAAEAFLDGNHSDQAVKQAFLRELVIKMRDRKSVV